MSDATVADVAKKVTGWSIAISVLMIVAGLLAILLPLEAGIAVNIFVGWMLIFAAAAHFVYAWSTRGTGGVIWKVLVGILYGVIGFYLLEHPARGLATLTLVLAYYLLIEGVMEIILFFQHRSGPGAVWFLLDGIVTLILGVPRLEDVAFEHGMGDWHAGGLEHSLQRHHAADAFACGTAGCHEDGLTHSISQFQNSRILTLRRALHLRTRV